MSNLTITINLDSLTPTQLAALHVVIVAGMGGTKRKAANYKTLAAGMEKCGDEYPPEYKRVSDFLLNLDKEVM